MILMTELKRRRNLLLLGLALYVPLAMLVAWIGYSLTGTYAVGFIGAAVGMVLFLIAFLRWALFPCAQCGNRLGNVRGI
jgi:hypothetical protein